MEKVLEQARLLAVAILESEEYTNMHQAELAAMKDEKATNLIAAYQEKRQKVEELLATPDMDKGSLAAAGEELENVEHAIEENAVLHRMQHTNDEFTEMMKKVNNIIQFVVTGKAPQENVSSCTGSCETCGSHCH